MACSQQIVCLTLVCFTVLGVIISTASAGGVQKEKYIIHVPVKYHTIHHVKVQKVPVYIKKHVHHHKHIEHEPVVVPQLEEEEGHHGYDRYDEYSSEESRHGAYGAYDNSEEYY